MKVTCLECDLIFEGDDAAERMKDHADIFHMKAPDKGHSYNLEEYGYVIVKGGPSPEEPYVHLSLGYDSDDNEQLKTIHIDEFHERRIE